MLCYGVANMANDAWDEQVFKRGWSGWQFPSVTTPAPSAAWGVLVAAAAGVWLVAFRSRAGSPGGAGEAPAVPPAVR
jgi:hypothetical protein